MKKIISTCVLSLALAFQAAPAARELRPLDVGTTTSVQASGLLDVILPPFGKARGLKINVIAVGTGAALKLMQNGDVDVVIVHAKEAELDAVNAGYGVGRTEFMFNEFVIAGPKSDPAGINGMSDAVEAFRNIAASKSLLISRGDNSGTHIKELALWKEAGIKPEGAWRIEVGQGMAEALVIAGEKQAYILADEATYLTLKDKIDLEILSRGDARLRNVYSVIATNPKTHPDINNKDATALIAWVTSPECQKLIGDYKKNGITLFNPMVHPGD